jgi:L-fuculose-phosphate aldolase
MMALEPAAPLQDTADLRRQVISTCLFLRDRLGYFIGTWGNVSVRVEEGLLLTPSRTVYHELQPKDLVVVSWESVIVKGHRLPTSEMELHRALMQERPAFGALIHAHSPYASTVASAHRSIPVILDDMAEVIGGEVQCARHVSAGKHKEMAQAAREAIGKEACAVLLGNHGVVAGGRDLEEALVALQFVEKAAMVLIHAQSLGGAVPIPEPLWREERERYLYKYGRAEDMHGVIADAAEPE